MTKKLFIEGFELLVFCSLGLSYYLFNDTIQAFEDPLVTHFNVTSYEIQIQYSIAACVNLFTAPIAGILSKKYGLGFCAVFFACCSSLGVYVTFYGVYLTNFKVFEFGRFIFSFWNLATYSFTISAVLKNFEGKKATLALSIALATAKLIQACSNYLLPEIMIKTRSLGKAFFVAGLICTMQIFGSIYYLNVKEKKEEEEVFTLDFVNKETVNSNPENDNYIRMGSSTQASPDYSRQNSGEKNSKNKKTKIRFGHLVKFGVGFWSLVLIYSCSFSTFVSLLGTFTDMMTTKYGFEYKAAKNFISICQLLLIGLILIFGKIIQKTGRKLVWLFVSHIFLIAAFVVYLVMSSNRSKLAYIAVVLLAVYYSIFCSCVYALVAQSLPESFRSFGQALMLGLLQINLILYPIFIGNLTKSRSKDGYFSVIIFWMSVAFGVLVVCGVLIGFEIFVRKELMLEEGSEEYLILMEKKEKEFLQVSNKNEKRQKIDFVKEKKKVSMASLI